MEPETRRELIENMDPHMRGVFEGLGPEEQHRFLDWRLFLARQDAAERALAEWEGHAPITPEILAFVEHAVGWLADKEYPVVWVGEAGIMVEELLELQQHNDELPEWMRVEPGETIRPEDHEGAGGITIPGPGVHYLDGLTVVEEFSDHMLEHSLAELQAEVAHIRAAKLGMVLVITDSRERYEEGLPPIWSMITVEELEPKDVSQQLLANLEFYANDTMGPYVMHDSERARRAVDARLGSSEP